MWGTLFSAIIKISVVCARYFIVLEVNLLKKIFGFLFMFVFIFCQGASAAVVVDLARYLEMVKEGNHALRSNLRAVEAAYFGVRASVGNQRPNIGFSGSASYVTDHRQTAGSPNRHSMTYGTSLSLTQSIDISGVHSLDEQQQILNFENQRATFYSNVNALLATAERVFWAAVLARENIALQEDVLRQRMENNRVTEEKYRQQLVPRLDRIRSEAQVVAAEALVTEARAQYRNVLANMMDLAGGIEVTPIIVPLTVPEFDVNVCLERAFESRPDIRAANLALERSEIIRRLTARGLSPTLTAAIRWTPWSEPWNSSSPQRGEVGASLTLNIPIFDGNATRFSTLNADRLIQAAEAGLESVKNTARMELIVAQNNWEMAAALEQARRRQVERSDEELRITELMYNEGMGAQIDLINAQTDNQLVRTEYLNAIQGMYAALIDLRRAMGEYAPNAGGTWNEAVRRYGRGNI